MTLSDREIYICEMTAAEAGLPYYRTADIEETILRICPGKLYAARQEAGKPWDEEHRRMIGEYVLRGTTMLIAPIAPHGWWRLVG